MEKTTLYLPRELQAALKSASRAEGRPQADIVRDALARYLAEQPRPRPKSIGAASAGLRAGVDASEVKKWGRERWRKDLERKYPSLGRRDADA